MVDVSVIIVAHNTKQLVHDCLESVYDQTDGITFEVIYVDNASTDCSTEVVTQAFPRVIIIQNKDNKGFTAANNQAIEIAKGRYVLLLNSDTIVLDNAIAKTVKFADEHPEAAVVGCKVLNPDKTIQRNCFMDHSILNFLLSSTYLHKIFSKSRFFGREWMSWWDYNEDREVDAVKGCYAFVRKEAIDQVGPMDDTYFFYGDDADWCYRFRKSGWKVLFTPDPQIIHYGGQTVKRMKEKFLFQLFGSRLIFMKLHRNRLAFSLSRFLLASFFFLRIPYWLAMAVIKKSEREKSFQTAKTYLMGCLYCLTNWKKLLINKEKVQERL
jgi:GT2 family glycosyltransferase